MKKAKRFLTCLLCFALVFVIGGGVFFSAFSLTASAAETTFDINTSDPLEDLKGSTIEGVPFDVKNYNPKSKTYCELIMLAEVGYGSSDLVNYDVYIYVYTPKILLKNGSGSVVMQQILLKASDGSVKQYPMDILSYSVDSIYGGYFYKLKIDFMGEKESFYSSLEPSNRLYYVDAVQLLRYDGRVEWENLLKTEKKFFYSGYAQGNGDNETDKSTLALKTDKSDALSLDVRSTYFRLPGIKNAQGTERESVIDAQDSLHSVYFAVPNRYINEYGGMTKVHATWYDALLAPALVLGDTEIYNACLPYLDKDPLLLGGLSYNFTSDFFEEITSGLMTKTYRYYGYCWNYNPRGDDGMGMLSGRDYWARQINDLHFLYLADLPGKNAADTFVLSSERIQQKVAERTEVLAKTNHDEVVYEFAGQRFALSLFDSISLEPTEVEIEATDNFYLEASKVSQNWWQSIWGTETVTPFDTKGISGIYAVKSSDFEIEGVRRGVELGFVNAEEFNEALEQFNADNSRFWEFFSPLIADSLCIARNDVDEFKYYYDEQTAAGKTVYLFRYQVSDYLCEEVRIKDKVGQSFGTNGYFFQMNVNLAFDIIDVTFTKNGLDTVVAVVMDPINIFHDATPPVDTNNDSDKAWWEDMIKVLFFFVFVLIVVVLLSYLLPLISPILSVFGTLLKTLFSLLLLPFRAIGNLFKRR